MNVTNDMLKAAIEKAIEAGLLPKYARKADSVAEHAMIKLVLQAALDARSRIPPASSEHLKS
jgi:hypothetical protein